ncbi:hypothetical protein GGX14DRAFT_372475 [Mycena pura]|uniref:Uncharacterized protein n=1 Tax=Mycena pura TaxID=153505 RepID=A0AAD6V542_9AGAR|nr:hypothetical protein GGX14DRAFT_372475 [Mycena pura]
MCCPRPRLRKQPSHVCVPCCKLRINSQSPQIRKLAFALVNSTTNALPAWRQACQASGMKVRLLPRDVRTRWNSTYDMLVVAVQYKAVINVVTADRDLNLRQHDLSNAEWGILEDMVYTLKDATLLFSSDNRSTIANVITTMDKIDDLITTSIASASSARRARIVHSSIRKALGLAKKTMNKYYSATDASNVYRIAMGECIQFLSQ